MARITVEEVYGEKIRFMSALMSDYLKNGRPEKYDEPTWLDMLIVKHTLIAEDQYDNRSISETHNIVNINMK